MPAFLGMRMDDGWDLDSVEVNGAAALPCVRATRPPDTHIMIGTGNSRYLLRTRMKHHNSMTSVIGNPRRQAHRPGPTDSRHIPAKVR
jgi:hypothetical protein